MKGVFLRMPGQEVEKFFNNLYQNTKDEILMYIIAKCGDTHEISDIFQETYMEIVRLLKKKGIAHFKQPEAIVMTIAKRKVYQHLNLRQKLGFGKIRYEQIEEMEEEWMDSEDFTLDDSMTGTEAVELFQKILGKQDILSRKILYLKFYMGLSIKKIAELMEISEGMVKNCLCRSIKSMKDEWEKGVDAYEKQRDA